MVNMCQNTEVSDVSRIPLQSNDLVEAFVAHDYTPKQTIHHVKHVKYLLNYEFITYLDTVNVPVFRLAKG